MNDNDLSSPQPMIRLQGVTLTLDSGAGAVNILEGLQYELNFPRCNIGAPRFDHLA